MPCQFAKRQKSDEICHPASTGPRAAQASRGDHGSQRRGRDPERRIVQDPVRGLASTPNVLNIPGRHDRPIAPAHSGALLTRPDCRGTHGCRASEAEQSKVPAQKQQSR